MKIFLAISLFIFLFFGASGSSIALANTPATTTNGSAVVQKITIRGIVPYMRVIYVNSKKQVVKVVGNTNKNIKPMAIDINTRNQTEVTADILIQYQKILAANDNRLIAGKTYYPAQDKLSLKSTLLKFSVLRLPTF